MRKIFLTIIAALALIASIADASAQNNAYASQTVVNYIGTSTNCAGSTATNIAAVIPCGKQKDVAIQFSSRNDAAGTAVLGAYIRRSVDGTRYDTAAQYVTWAANGASDATITTNINTHGCGFIKIDAITNAAAATVNTTNLVIKYAVKINAP